MGVFLKEEAQLLDPLFNVHGLLFRGLEQGPAFGYIFMFNLIDKDEDGLRRFGRFPGNDLGYSLADIFFLNPV